MITSPDTGYLCEDANSHVGDMVSGYVLDDAMVVVVVELLAMLRWC
jgi:hypothetical protein